MVKKTYMLQPAFEMRLIDVKYIIIGVYNSRNIITKYCSSFKVNQIIFHASMFSCKLWKAQP